MSIGEIIDAAIAVYRRNFAPLFGIAAVVQVPLMALQLTAMHPITSAVLHSREGALRWQELAPSAGLLLAALVLAMLIGPLAEAALAMGVSERYLGRDIGVGRAYRAARGKWPRVLWTSIIYWVLIYLFAGLALLVLVGPFLTYVLAAGGSEALASPLALVLFILGILLCAGAVAILLAVAVRYMLGPAIVVAIEGKWGLEAMNRSAELTAGRGWSAFVVMAILILMVSVVSLGVAAPLQILTFVWAQDEPKLILAQTGYQLLATLVTILMRPLYMVGAVLIYYDLRIRKEGFDLYMMAEALGIGLEPTPQTPAIPDAGETNPGESDTQEQ